MRKSIIIYDTGFGNTEKIAKALAIGLENQGVNVDCVKVNDVVLDKLVEYDFFAVGGPTHMLGMSKPMKDFLEELKTIDISGKRGFCFDTRNQSRFNRFDLNSAAKRIEKKLKKMKVRMIKPRKSAIVNGREGPLEDGMEQMFERLGGELAELVRGGDSDWK